MVQPPKAAMVTIGIFGKREAYFAAASALRGR